MSKLPAANLLLKSNYPFSVTVEWEDGYVDVHQNSTAKLRAKLRLSFAGSFDIDKTSHYMDLAMEKMREEPRPKV